MAGGTKEGRVLEGQTVVEMPEVGVEPMLMIGGRRETHVGSPPVLAAQSALAVSVVVVQVTGHVGALDASVKFGQS